MNWHNYVVILIIWLNVFIVFLLTCLLSIFFIFSIWFFLVQRYCFEQGHDSLMLTWILNISLTFSTFFDIISFISIFLNLIRKNYHYNFISFWYWKRIIVIFKSELLLWFSSIWFHVLNIIYHFHS
jgi:hypothetical protein